MKYLGAVLLTIMLVGCSFSLPNARTPQKDLVIRQYPAHQVIARYSIGSLEQFSLSFIHSVSKTPVRDDYIIDGNKIIQITEIFEAHGAGLPSDTLDAGALGWEHRNGQFILRLHRPIPRLIVQTDMNYLNHLQLGQVDVDLNQWENQALEICIEEGSSE